MNRVVIAAIIAAGLVVGAVILQLYLESGSSAGLAPAGAAGMSPEMATLIKYAAIGIGILIVGALVIALVRYILSLGQPVAAAAAAGTRWSMPRLGFWGIILLLAAAALGIYLMSIGTEGLQNRWTLATETLSWDYGPPAKWAVLVLFGVATLVAALKSDLSFGEKAAALGAWALVFLIIGPHLVRADWPNTPATAYTAPAYTTPAAYTPPAGAYTSCHETSTKLVGARGAEINPYAGPTGKRCSSRFVIEGNRGCVNVKRYGREYWEPHEFCADRPNVSLPRDVQFIRSTTGPLTVHVKLVPAVIN